MAIASLEKSQDWHDKRRTGIGGSDAGVIAGFTWGGKSTLYNLWQLKTGRIDPVDLSGDPKVRAGTLLEPVAIGIYRMENPHLTIFHRKEMTVSKSYPWAYAHLDFTIHQPNAEWIPGEVKCPSDPHGWGISGSDDIPDYYMPQIQHNLAVTGKPYMIVVAFISGWDLRWYHVARDQAYIDTLMEREAEFWAAVETNSEPALSSADDVKARFPIATEGTVVATPTVIAALSAYREAKEQISILEEAIEGLVDTISIGFGEFNTLVDGNNTTLATYKTISAEKLDEKKLKAEQPDIVAAYQKISRYRRLNLAKVKTPQQSKASP